MQGARAVFPHLSFVFLSETFSPSALECGEESGN